MTPSTPKGSISKVLVVDDDTDTAETMALLLRLLGHDVQVAFDGHRAIEIARIQRPDFVLLDMRMPRLDGYQVASRIRRETAGPVVIIAITGCGQEDERRRALTAGCDHHLLKPVDPQALVAMIGASDAGPDRPARGGPSPRETGVERTPTLTARRHAEIINDLGLHLRAADRFARLAQRFRAEVRVGFEGKKVNGRSILDLTTLAAACGSVVELEADGPDAEEALVSLAGLMGCGFNEQ